MVETRVEGVACLAVATQSYKIILIHIIPYGPYMKPTVHYRWCWANRTLSFVLVTMTYIPILLCLFSKVAGEGQHLTGAAISHVLLLT